jgi:hypothetical protein
VLEPDEPPADSPPLPSPPLPVAPVDALVDVPVDVVEGEVSSSPHAAPSVHSIATMGIEIEEACRMISRGAGAVPPAWRREAPSMRDWA